MRWLREDKRASVWSGERSNREDLRSHHLSLMQLYEERTKTLFPGNALRLRDTISGPVTLFTGIRITCAPNTDLRCIVVYWPCCCCVCRTVNAKHPPYLRPSRLCIPTPPSPHSLHSGSLSAAVFGPGSAVGETRGEGERGSLKRGYTAGAKALGSVSQTLLLRGQGSAPTGEGWTRCLVADDITISETSHHFLPHFISQTIYRLPVRLYYFNSPSAN